MRAVSGGQAGVPEADAAQGQATVKNAGDHKVAVAGPPLAWMSCDGFQ